MAPGPLTVVYGSPGSGRLDIVTRQARPTDHVVDLRVITRALCGKPYAPELLTLAQRRRFTLARELSRSRTPVWLVVEGTAEGPPSWVRSLRPSGVIRVDAPLSACLARINADPQRPPEQRRIDTAGARAWHYPGVRFA